ncbi:MAG TPA: hypothetical protein VIJ09_05535 [Acidimicrobiales bacterium]
MKARSTWTLLPSGFPCESEVFGRNHTFDAFDHAGGDKGKYKATKILTLTWTAGTATGAKYRGTWNKSTGHYAGTWVLGTGGVPASLVPVAATGCAVVTTAPVSSSVSQGSTDADNVTVTGQDGFTPTGPVHFYVCPEASSPCTSTSPGVTNLGSATLTPSPTSVDVATATSSPSPTESPGSYCFLGSYAGNPHYSVSSDGSTSDECFTVGGSGGL